MCCVCVSVRLCGAPSSLSLSLSTSVVKKSLRDRGPARRRELSEAIREEGSIKQCFEHVLVNAGKARGESWDVVANHLLIANTVARPSKCNHEMTGQVCVCVACLTDGLSACGVRQVLQLLLTRRTNVF